VLAAVSGDISPATSAAHAREARRAEALFRPQADARSRSGVARRRGAANRFGSRSRTPLSLLAFHDPHAVVKGLDLVPESNAERPAVHLSFR